MYNYINKQIKLKKYASFEEPLKEEQYNIGSTYEDYLAGKWILLTDEQVEFANMYPRASIKEILDCKLTEVPVYERTLEDAKQEMLNTIYNYDNSSAVNEFTINDELRTWFTPEQRANYKNSIDSADLLDIETLQLLVNGQVLQLPTQKAAQLLAMIQLYADACYMVTEQHKAAVSALNSIEEVDNYDYKVGYPKKLNFEL